MKKFISSAAAAILSAVTITASIPAVSHAENPIVQTSFTPDPAPVVFDDELYVFTGCDRDAVNDFYKMTGQVSAGVVLTMHGHHSVSNETASTISISQLQIRPAADVLSA